ncbi:DEAD/DEAH box helicase [Weissella confusa]|uniref:DEAD/DEAH box helicase n=1 Tax=Weissella confusa TaxID=1583 RepID=UPI00223BDEEC|nr:DEAD/DEAH box helicase [Weissella confusa]MCS9997133.1 DEAD/DEAH box helicase [Weissella confusa]
MPFELRDYQLELIDGVYSELQKGNKHVLIQSPAGSGKSATMSEIAKRATDKGNRIMFVVHRVEIVNQIKKTFATQGVDMSLATIGMINTIEHKKEKLPRPSVIFVDEAHHSLAATYRRLLEYFDDAVHLLFTATPVRLSGEGFEDVADAIVLGKSVSWLIENNYLAPFEYYAPTLMDLEALKVSHGDYTKKSMREASQKVIFGDVVKHYQRLANGTQAFVYAADVGSSKSVVEEFLKAGISAAHVDGTTPKEERAEIVKRFGDGEIKILSNAELFLEGVDSPNVETVIQLRPTQSLSMYIQFAMRSMRYKPGKTAIIIDHVGNYAKHGFPDTEHEWTLKGEKKSSSPALPVPKFNEEFTFTDPQERRAYEIRREAELEHLRTVNKKPEVVLDFRDYSDGETFEELAEIAKAKGHKVYRAVREAYNRGIPYPHKYYHYVNKFIRGKN